MTLKDLFMSALVVVLVGTLGFVALTRSQPAPVDQQPPLGATAGSDDSNPYHSQGGLQSYDTVSACNTASSTIFAAKNPFNATSTISVSIQGTMGATTSDIVVATSTVGSPTLTTSTATSSLNENILGAQIAALAQFSTASGVTLGGDSNWKSPSANGFISNRIVAIAPTEYVIAFSTSTLPSGAGGTGATQVSVPSKCTVDVHWTKL